MTPRVAEWHVDVGGVLHHPSGVYAIAPDARGGEQVWTLFLPAGWGELEEGEEDRWSQSAAVAYSQFLLTRH